MRPIACDVLKMDQHWRSGRLLADLRHRVAVMTRVTLSGRVPARVLDAALNVDRRLATLCLRLADAVSGGPAERAYALDAPVIKPGPPVTTRRLSVEQHRTLGVELHRLRNEAVELATGLRGHYVKSSGIGQALHTPERAIDRLRCKLDDLFCVQHPEQFDTRAYYPGRNALLPVTDSNWVGNAR